MTPVDRTEISREFESLAGATAPANLLEEYYPRISRSDRERYGMRTLAALAAAHLRLAEGYDGNGTRISIRNPEQGADDYVGNRTIIDIVVGDHRHTVASVVAELTRFGLAIRDVHHPILTVDRSGGGMRIFGESELARTSTDTAVLPVITADQSADAAAESWIRVEIDRIAEDEFAEIEAGLARTIDFVIAAESDRDSMQSRAAQIARELRDRAPRADLAGEAAEAAELLDWLSGRFLFLGYREYRLGEEGGQKVLTPVDGTALGISALRDTTGSPLSLAVAAKAEEPHVLVLTKANSRSRVLRRSYMDYLGVKIFDEAGNIVGERRFVGLFLSSVYSSSVLEIPVVRVKAKEIIRRSGIVRETQDGDDLLSALQTYPRDDLFHADVDDIYDVIMEVLDLQERHEARVFVRRDTYERYVSVLVYLPRDVYDTKARMRVQQVLRDHYHASEVDYDVLLSDSALARLHFVARVPRSDELPRIDEDALAKRIIAALRSWHEDLWEILAPAAEKSPSSSVELARRWTRAFPASYVESHAPADAVSDLEVFRSLGDDERTAVRIVRGTDDEIRLKLYRREPVTLTTVLPYLANLGAEVIDEQPFELVPADGESRRLYEFGLDFGRSLDDEVLPDIEQALLAAWSGKRESGPLDRLLLIRGLLWQDIAVIQALTQYLRQAGFAYSDASISAVFTDNPEISGKLVEMFAAKFDPDADFADLDARREAVAAARAEIESLLGEVASLDADRLLRAAAAIIDAMVRTNFFQRGEGDLPEAVVYKLMPRELDFLPKPRPALEMWVHSPIVEGVHLRFGTVARGGLRWSDRRDDFRTEVLGLVKAQMVKNALIVPTGAKGGFYPKQLPDPAVDRDAWAAAGQAAYELFIGALLDVADNLEYDGLESRVVQPERTVVHDGDDHYLVVAADKGTARFSDVANRISAERGFWLGDAFASGGSVGYDHKAMGITSRGAWKSVERHLRELGVNAAEDDFTVVGIGDMSGDVFGNGMRRSEHIRLVAAFDHRDVFLDPNPDAASSFAERERLYSLPRSSWQDYDKALISDGGGVFPRSSKSIDVSPQAAEALGIEPGPLSPDELISAILRAPVDLLYNGGIGTYVKAGSESHAEVGDKANDAIRIDGSELRTRVVGEGGNLGFTQRGRIEAALRGVKLNTDAVDNSAGVDCSDREVNIKLLLAALIRAGEFSEGERADVLHSMTDDVAELVLADNYAQNIALGEARDRAKSMTGTQVRLMRFLEREADLDRVVEALPSDDELKDREDRGLVSPELAVLLAYVKMHAADEILDSDVPDEDWTAAPLERYFPKSLGQYSELFSQHPLRREIATAWLVNRIVDRGGLTYIYRMQEETGARVAHIARIYTIVMEVFGLDEHFDAICALDNVVDTHTQVMLQHRLVRLLDRASRWLVHQAPDTLDVRGGIERYSAVVERLRPRIGELLGGVCAEEYSRMRDEAIEQGVPEEIAARSAGLLDEFALLDIAQVSERSGVDPEDAAAVYFRVTDLLSGTPLLHLIGDLDRSSRWTALARGAMRDDYYQAVLSIVAAVLEVTEVSGDSPDARADARIAQWRERNETVLTQLLETIAEIRALDAVDQAPLSVLLRMMRSTVRSTLWQSENS